MGTVNVESANRIIIVDVDYAAYLALFEVLI